MLRPTSLNTNPPRTASAGWDGNTARRERVVEESCRQHRSEPQVAALVVILPATARPSRASRAADRAHTRRHAARKEEGGRGAVLADEDCHCGGGKVQAEEVQAGVQKGLPRRAHGQDVHRGGPDVQGELRWVVDGGPWAWVVGRGLSIMASGSERLREMLARPLTFVRVSLCSLRSSRRSSASVAVSASRSALLRPSTSSTCQATWALRPPTATDQTPSSSTVCRRPALARFLASLAPTESASRRR